MPVTLSARRLPRRRVMWGVLAALLVLPALAMPLTGEVAWGGADFAVAALLLCALGLGVELAVRVAPSAGLRAALGLGVVVLAALVWAQLAVGIL